MQPHEPLWVRTSICEFGWEHNSPYSIHTYVCVYINTQIGMVKNMIKIFNLTGKYKIEYQCDSTLYLSDWQNYKMIITRGFVSERVFPYNVSGKQSY